MKRIVIVVFALISISILSGCGQTEEDIVNQEILIGYWKPVDSDGDLVTDVPLYCFKTDNQGSSTLYSTTDTMQWELKRNQLKIYYDKAPAYYIGYDKYNSRSLARIQDISANRFEVTQFYSDGFQRDIIFQRYDPEE